MKGKEDSLSVKSSEPLVVGLDLPSEKRAAAHYEPTPELAAQYEKKFNRHRRIFQCLCEEEIMAS